MKTLVINGITINCLFSELSEEQKQGPAHQQQGIQQYKDLQVKAVEEYFGNEKNSKPLLDAGVTTINVNSRIQHIKDINPKDLVQLPMGLVFYEPKLLHLRKTELVKSCTTHNSIIKSIRARIKSQHVEPKKLPAKSKSKKVKRK